MSLYIVILSFFANLLIYVWFSLKVKTWVNVLTPQFVLSVPTLYVAEFVYLLNENNDLLGIGYFALYLTYFLINFSFVFGYLYLRRPGFALNYGGKVEYGYPVVLFFAAVGFALYYPVINTFWDYLLDPRAIYVATRTGFGLNFFLSATFNYIFLALILMKPGAGWFSKTLGLVFALIFAYLHGSKGQIFSVVFIWMIWYFVVERRSVGFYRFCLISSLFGVFGAGLFFNMLISVDLRDLIFIISAYADYSRNAIMIILSDSGSYLGRLFFEENLYSRAPRFLFPDKPKDFGSYELAKMYFPDSFYKDEGVPSFGIGVYFADFSYFAIPILILASFLGGWLAKIFVIRVSQYRNPADFILLLFFCGIPLVPIGVGFLLPEHFLIAFFVYFTCRFFNVIFRRKFWRG